MSRGETADTEGEDTLFFVWQRAQEEFPVDR
jgi:hypothetical protein